MTYAVLSVDFVLNSMVLRNPTVYGWLEICLIGFITQPSKLLKCENVWKYELSLYVYYN